MAAIVSGPITPREATATLSVPAEANTLPPGFPAQLKSELCWDGSDPATVSNYIYILSPSKIAEVVAAIGHFNDLGLDGDKVSRNNFPLPTLGPELEQLGNDIYNGRGFCLIRGLDPKDLSVEDLTLAYLGIQAYMADMRGRQDSRGNMLVHIVADKAADGHHRHSNKAITFHNEESGDIVSWLTRSTATAGGKCIIASAYTNYNILAAQRPDLIRVLARSDWPFAIPTFECRPVIYYQNDRLIMNVGRTPLIGNATHPRPDNLPKISAVQLEALDAIEAIAKATQLEIQTQAGDMHFINNLAVLHRREGFTDGSVAEEKRHLVRMRLRSSSLGWDIPESLQREWFEAFNKRGRQTWHLEPMPSMYFPLRRQPN